MFGIPNESSEKDINAEFTLFALSFLAPTAEQTASILNQELPIRQLSTIVKRQILYCSKRQPDPKKELKHGN